MQTTRKMYTYANDFADFVKTRESGNIPEIDEEMYDYWLGVLPPIYFPGGIWKRPDGTTQRVDFGFAEGWELITAFWHTDGMYFAQLTNKMNRGY